MSIKSWFGRNLYKMLQETKREQEDNVKAVQDMERMFGSASPCVVAFRINNGYVVRTVSDGDLISHRQSGFVYCKDHQAIADHILTTAVKEKMGLQQEMFPGAVLVSQEQAQAFSPNLTTTGRFTNRSI